MGRPRSRRRRQTRRAVRAIRRDRPTTRKARSVATPRARPAPAPASEPAPIPGAGGAACGVLERARTWPCEPLALILPATRLLRDFSRCWGRTTRAKLLRIHRTFGCRHRHMSVGGFQRPISKRAPPSDDIPLARRRAFPGISSRRTSRAETAGAARPSGCRWRPSAAPERTSGRAAQAASIAPPSADMHTANSLWLPQPSKSFPKIGVSSKLPRVQNGALILKSCMHCRNIGAGFQPVSRLTGIK